MAAAAAAPLEQPPLHSRLICLRHGNYFNRRLCIAVAQAAFFAGRESTSGSLARRQLARSLVCCLAAWLATGCRELSRGRKAEEEPAGCAEASLSLSWVRRLHISRPPSEAAACVDSAAADARRRISALARLASWTSQVQLGSGARRRQQQQLTTTTTTTSREIHNKRTSLLPLKLPEVINSPDSAKEDQQ